ncbi:MAG: efflux RND transporter periplasmic adaptor subunit [Zoogloeaceae bacterium]|jgi:RND family efflux transporter MFP subunit|nr:efflux RND transporter periplasmic adaptor subunit [Zoogloeaceae bacterium]
MKLSENVVGVLFGVFLAQPLLAAGFVSDCLIEPNQKVDLGSPVTGLLEQVLVGRADRVKKGQVLARLESRAETAATELARFRSVQTGPINMAENKVRFSQKKFDRRQAMAREKLMSAQERDDAEAELRLAQAELKVATENRQIARLEHRQQSGQLGLRVLRSPFDGVVVEQLAHPGEVVEPGAGKGVILRLAQLDPLRLRMVLPKSLFGKVAPQMTVEILPEIPANGRYVARVRSVDRLVDAASGAFVVMLELPNPKLQIPAGVMCKARFPEGTAAVKGPAAKSPAVSGK